MQDIPQNILDMLNNKENRFSSTVMMENIVFDKDDILFNLKHDWHINVNEDLEYYKEADNFILFLIDGYLCLITMENTPLKYEKIKDLITIKYNDDFAKRVKSHLAHIFVMVVGGNSKVHSALLHTKITHSVCKNISSLGAFFYSDVFDKNTFITISRSIKDNLLPINLWVNKFILSKNGKNILHTVGMNNFDHLEFEIYNIDNYDADDITSLIDNLIYFVIDNNIDFEDGHTFTIKSLEDKFDRVEIHIEKSIYKCEKSVIKIAL